MLWESSLLGPRSLPFFSWVEAFLGWLKWLRLPMLIRIQMLTVVLLWYLKAELLLIILYLLLTPLAWVLAALVELPVDVVL